MRLKKNYPAEMYEYNKYRSLKIHASSTASHKKSNGLALAPSHYINIARWHTSKLGPGFDENPDSRNPWTRKKFGLVFEKTRTRLLKTRTRNRKHRFDTWTLCTTYHYIKVLSTVIDVKSIYPKYNINFMLVLT